jgi:hypothetical protein
VALRAARRACDEMDVQFLDQTVAVTRLGVTWSRRGPALRREYGFEFSIQGDERRRGRVAMVSRDVVSVQLDHPEGLLILPAGHSSPGSSQVGVSSGEG